jgi:HEAT repeat protein
VALHRLGDRAAATILVTALAERSHAPSRIASQLDQFPIPIADLLLPMLSDDRPDARYWAASLLRRYTETVGVGSAVAALANDPHPPVRRAVLGTLGALGAEDAVVVAEQLLGDPVGYVRAHAARLYATARLRDADEATVRATARRLVMHLGDAEWDVRLAVKESLVLLGPGCWRDVAVLLESPDRFARNGAAEVLQNLGLVDVLVRDIGNGATVDAELVGVLERAFRAGGPGMVDAAAARSAGRTAGSAEALLARLGFVGGGDGLPA